jgi:hypothetical protein
MNIYCLKFILIFLILRNINIRKKNIVEQLKFQDIIDFSKRDTRYVQLYCILIFHKETQYMYMHIDFS